MKRLILLLLLISTVIGAVAQGIRKDSEKEDGSRFIDTEFITYGKRTFAQSGINGYGMDRILSMSCLASSTDTTYCVCVNLEQANKIMTMARGKRMVVKLDNDSILVWESLSDIGIMENEIIFSMGNSKLYRIYVDYIIPQKDIELIKEHDIVKYRLEIEWDEGYADFEPKYYKKMWRFRDAILEGYNILQKRLQKPIMDKLLENF